MSIRKKRLKYFLLIIITIPLGIGSRTYAHALPNFLAEYAGDSLYALCSFWAVRFVFIKPSLSTVTLISFTICILIETLQLYQAPWILAIRHTPPFGLLLGYGFLWSDWVCYAVGTLIALVIALMIERSHSRTGTKKPLELRG